MIVCGKFCDIKDITKERPSLYPLARYVLIANAFRGIPRVTKIESKVTPLR